MKKNYKQMILDYCNTLGIELVGFTECRVFNELRGFYLERKNLSLQNEFEEEDIEKRINPNSYYKEGKTIVSIAFPYLHSYKYIDNGFSVYTRGRDYHEVVNEYLEKICTFIKSLGGEAYRFVDSNSLPERYIAYLSGLGFIGKNNLLITKKYGSYVFLGEIITNIEIENSTNRTFEDINRFSECGNCEICYKECPTKAINKHRKNANICLSYITQKKEIDNEWMERLDGRVFGCDSCQKICPYNLEAEKSNIKEFYPFEFMNREDTDDLINLNNFEFKESIKKTSCGWRGKNVIIRNALIKKALHNNKKIIGIKFQSPYLKEYLNRLSEKDNL